MNKYKVKCKRKHLSRHCIIVYFYRIHSCLPNCEQREQSSLRALLVHVERALLSTAPLQSCSLLFRSVCVSLCTCRTRT